MKPLFEQIQPESIVEQATEINRRLFGKVVGAGLFALGYAAAADRSMAEVITTDDAGLLATNLTIAPLNDEGGYQIPAYVAFPNDGKKHPCVLVVGEVFGLHDYIRDICRRLAKAGYCALAPDLFARKGNAAMAASFDEVKALVEQAPYQQVMDDLKAMIAWLKSKPDLGQPKHKPFAHTGRIGITGFCWGGSSVWMAAETMPDIRAGVAWYGRLEAPAPDQFMGKEQRPWPVNLAKDLKKPVLGLYGGQDGGISQDSVARMRAELAKGDSQSEIVVYPNSGHAFHADYRKSYNEADAKDGWTRLLAWFERNLK